MCFMALNVLTCDQILLTKFSLSKSIMCYACVFQLRDCDMRAIVNRELKQRVRPIAGMTCHRPVVKADIKHAAKIVQNLDKKTGL